MDKTAVANKEQDPVMIVAASAEPAYARTYEESSYIFHLTSQEGITASFRLTKNAMVQFSNAMTGAAFMLMSRFPRHSDD